MIHNLILASLDNSDPFDLHNLSEEKNRTNEIMGTPYILN